MRFPDYDEQVASWQGRGRGRGCPGSLLCVQMSSRFTCSSSIARFYQFLIFHNANDLWASTVCEIWTEQSLADLTAGRSTREWQPLQLTPPLSVWSSQLAGTCNYVSRCPAATGHNAALLNTMRLILIQTKYATRSFVSPSIRCKLSTCWDEAWVLRLSYSPFSHFSGLLISLIVWHS